MKMIRRIFLVLLGLLVSSGVAMAQSSSSADSYVIGAGDLIEITVEQDSDLNGTRRVGPDGRISMPVLGSVELNGLTASEAEGRLQSLLEKYMTRATVLVVVREFESQSASIFGEVRHPGKIPVTANMTILKAISSAGGLSESHGSVIHILRLADNGLSAQLEIPIDDLLVRGDSDLNVPVFPNDVINVPPDPEVSIYLLGEVMKPGVVQFKGSDNVTLLRALAAAGGLTDRANTRSIIIKRVENNQETPLAVHLGRILSGEDEDIRLKDNDTIYVKESFF